MLYRINYRPYWRRILGIAEPDLHIKDIEFLLRGFAILIDGGEYKPSMTRFLNKFSTRCKTLDASRVNYLESVFDSFLDSCSNLPDFPFHKKGRFTISLYEAVFYAVCIDAFNNKSLIIEKIDETKLKVLKEDKGFIDASSSETANALNVKTRRDRALAILKPDLKIAT